MGNIFTSAGSAGHERNASDFPMQVIAPDVVEPEPQEGFPEELLALYKRILDAGFRNPTEDAIDAFVKAVHEKQMDLTDAFKQAKDLSGGGQVVPSKVISIFTRHYTKYPIEGSKAVVDAIIEAEIMRPEFINGRPEDSLSLEWVAFAYIDKENVSLNMLEWASLYCGEKDPNLAQSLASLVGAPVPEFHVRPLVGYDEIYYETVAA